MFLFDLSSFRDGPKDQTSDVQLHIGEFGDSGLVSLCYTPRNDKGLSNIGKARRALVDIGADRLELIGAAHQFHLLGGFG